MGKNLLQGGLGSQKVNPKNGKSIDDQADFFNSLYKNKDESIEDRKALAEKMVDSFYDLVTDFYESGWGQSFHFGPRGANESFRESIARHEYYIAAKLGLNHDEVALDMGCGIGGPMRNIAKFTGAKIVGVTINSYQVQRGNRLNEEAGLSHLCKLEEADFHQLPFKDNQFDKVFSIEATCHSRERRDVFGEAYRILKPGGLFATYEWCTTDKYDPKNPAHVRAKQQIEEGNALPDMISTRESLQAFLDVGFELVLEQDVHEFATANNQIPWYHSLEASFSLENLPHTTVGTMITDWLCWTLEKTGLAPPGTYKAHQVLLTAREGLVAGGQMGIFTPMLLLVGRKPEN